MEASTDLSIAALSAICALAVCFDVAHRRVPNALVLAGIALGLLFQVATVRGGGLFSTPAGGLGLGLSLAGGAVGLGLLLPFWLRGAMGAGDVKLLAMAGVWLGPLPVVYAAAWTALAGGVLALGWALWLRVLPQALHTLTHLLMARDGRGPVPADTSTPPVHGRMPYAIAVATGVGIEVARLVRGLA